MLGEDRKTLAELVGCDTVDILQLSFKSHKSPLKVLIFIITEAILAYNQKD